MAAYRPDPAYLVGDLDHLAALYPPATPRALGKESPVITPGYARLIEAAPYAILATRGPNGIDCSPRGDAPGFVIVLDEHTLLLPDRRGNNRLDTLRNLVQHDTIGLIFLIPGVGEAIRVRGTAAISTDPELVDRCIVRGVKPATVLVISVQRVYFQCQRAAVRSALWDPASRADRSSLPSAGDLQAEVGAMTAEQAHDYDATLDAYVAATLYEGPSRP